MITHDTIDRIMNTVRIEEVVGDFVQLRKRGVNLLGVCPFHNEKTPSFTVSPTKGIYKCFGCGKAGNSVNFIMEHEQCSYPEALRWLAGRYNIEIEETQKTEEEVQHRTERESLYILLAAAQKYYAEQLHNTDEGRTIALSYLKERGLSAKTIEAFGLGWSPGGRSNFSDYALKNGFTAEYLVKTGMAFQPEGQENVLLDRFRERIMFPIYNISGKVVGFGGRILRATGKEAKYINSPETEVYNKSKVLYGLNETKKAVRQEDNCIIVEGYMDVLSMYQAGVENVAASSGTSLTEEQLSLVKRFTENVTFLFDGDAAGQKAALRGIDMALGQGINVKLTVLPAEHDPDTFSKAHDTEYLQNYLKEQALNFVQFQDRLLKPEDRNDPIKKSEAAREMLNSLILIHDNIKRSLFIKEIEKATGIDEKVLYDELRRMYAEKFKKENKPFDVPIAPLPSAPQKPEIRESQNTIRQERQIIKILLLYGDKTIPGMNSARQHIVSELEEVEWDDPICLRIYELYSNAVAEGTPEDLHFQKILDPGDLELQSFVTNLMADNFELSENWKKFLGRPIIKPEDNFKDEIHSAITYFKLRKIMHLIRVNQEDLTKTQNPEEIDTLLEVHMHLSDMKKKISSDIGASIV